MSVRVLGVRVIRITPTSRTLAITLVASVLTLASRVWLKVQVVSVTESVGVPRADIRHDRVVNVLALADV